MNKLKLIRMLFFEKKKFSTKKKKKLNVLVSRHIASACEFISFLT